MPSCTFFGHRDCQEDIRPKLRQVIGELIAERRVDMFYVGEQGSFDAIVRSVLRQTEQEHPHISYAVVLAYLPGKDRGYGPCPDTMLPEGIERVHPRYAISWRNDWMLRRSDYVVAYTTRPWGGAYRWTEKAIKQGKTVIDIGR